MRLHHLCEIALEFCRADLLRAQLDPTDRSPRPGHRGDDDILKPAAEGEQADIRRPKREAEHEARQVVVHRRHYACGEDIQGDRTELVKMRRRPGHAKANRHGDPSDHELGDPAAPAPAAPTPRTPAPATASTMPNTPPIVSPRIERMANCLNLSDRRSTAIGAADSVDNTGIAGIDIPELGVMNRGRDRRRRGKHHQAEHERHQTVGEVGCGRVQVLQIVDRDERLDRAFQQDPLAEPDEDHDDGEDADTDADPGSGQGPRTGSAIAPVA